MFIVTEYAALTRSIQETPKRVLLQTEDPDEMQHYAAFHQGLHCQGKKDP